MKAFKLLAVVLLGTMTGIAQQKKLKDPLPPDAFSRMIVQDITYAIVGENMPVSGIKVDVSKPEGTISAMFPTKKKWIPWDILGFELKGGVTDRNFNFFKGGFSNGNSAFEFKPSFHRITWHNSAKYGKPSVAEPNKKIVLARNVLVKRNTARLLDTFYVVTRLYNHHLGSIKDVRKDLPKEVAVMTPTVEHQQLAAYFIPKIVKNPSLKIDPSMPWDNIVVNLPKVREDTNNVIDVDTYYDEVVTLYKKYEKLYEGHKDDELDKMIANANHIWTQKKYLWWTLIPFFRSDKANEYYTKHQDQDSLYFKSGYRFSWGGSLYANRYWVTPNKIAVLARVGATISNTNNLSNLTLYNYENRTPFFEYGSSVTEKTITGSAYNNRDIVTGWEKQFGAELYVLPLGTVFPGLYLSSNIGHSELYKLPKVKDRTNDTFKAGAEAGLVFNINNRDKDKTLLSIITYFKYADFTDSQRTSLATGIEETKEDFQKRNISIGLKVGIPITLPKQNN